MDDLNLYIIIVIVILVISNLLLSIITFSLYRWRQSAKEGNDLIVIPEQLLNRMDKLEKLVSGHSELALKLTKKVISAEQANATQIEKASNYFRKTITDNGKNINEHLLGIQKLAENHSKEVAKFREGYDYSRYKVFLKTIITLLEQTNEHKETLSNKAENINIDTKEIIEDIHDDLMILLENNGIEIINPEIGCEYSIENKYFKVIKKYKPDSEKDGNTIKAVVKVGFCLELGNNENKLLKPAEIEIFKKF